MTDPRFELMCNPDRFCCGKGCFGEVRPRKLTYRKCFNARLLDIDGRFAKDLDYLLVANITEAKQVLYDATTLHGDRSLPENSLPLKCKTQSF